MLSGQSPDPLRHHQLARWALDSRLSPKTVLGRQSSNDVWETRIGQVRRKNMESIRTVEPSEALRQMLARSAAAPTGGPPTWIPRTRSLPMRFSTVRLAR